MTVSFRSFLLAGAALAVMAAPALAASSSTVTQADIQALQRTVADLNNQVQELKRAQLQEQSQASSDTSAALTDLKRSTSDQYVDLNNQIANADKDKPKVSLDNGRFSVASSDGRFSVSLRSLVQFDEGYFSQGKNPASVDLNSGSNFRRAQLGVVGTAWRDWAYNFTYDFGGNGVEKNGYIYYAYIEYTGLAPFHARIGALTPFLGIEDSTGSGDLMFLERASAQDVARNIAGSPGREGIDLFAQGNTYLLSVSYTGKKTTDAATFDAQQALVARASWLAVDDSDVKWLLDAGATYVFKLPDAAANTATSNVFSFSNGPELAVDSSKTVNTGNLDASKVNQYDLETAFEYDGLYAQGGWDHYQIIRRTSLPNPDFSGWYAQASYSLTGESHSYDPTTASFRNLRPAHPVGEGGWGAWEIAARYSNLDLDYQPLKSTALGGVPGGDQNVWTLGVNWYPTNGLKFQFDYYNIQVAHVNAPANDISANAFGARGQLSF
jgi:phosphate-selective porin OprO and OprP